jgi:hypothetical protein
VIEVVVVAPVAAADVAAAKIAVVPEVVAVADTGTLDEFAGQRGRSIAADAGASRPIRRRK